MAAVSASYVSSLYNAGGFASGVSKRMGGQPNATASKTAPAIEERLSEALNAMKTAPREQKQAARNRARERVEAVREQLKMIKELYAQNPKEMAKALRHLVKELKAALKSYKEAGGDMGALGGAAGLTALSASPAPVETKPSEQAEAEGDASEEARALEQDAEAETAAADPAPTSGADQGTPQPPMASASMDALERRLGERMGDEDFVSTVEGLKTKIKELFETAKIQSAFMARDKARESAFEALDEDLKALDEDATDFKREVQDEIITLRMEIKMIERGDLASPVSVDVSA